MRSVAEILIGVRSWAARQTGVSGVALVGSHARGEARADSDVDLVLLCEAPDDFVRDTSWVRGFGEVTAIQVEQWGAVTSLRVHYRGGVEVESGLSTSQWAEIPADPGTRHVVARGTCVPFDRDGALRRLIQEIDPGAAGDDR
jgi:predicted nucleotidyltransferase